MRKLYIILITLIMAPALSGCIVLGGAALVTGMAVGTVATVAKTTIGVGGAVIDAVIPDSNEDQER
jgi:hypothetical protein